MLNMSLTTVHNVMIEPPNYVAIPSTEKETLSTEVIGSDGKVSNEILCIIQAPDSIDGESQHPIVHDLEDVLISSNTEFETLSDDMIILNLHQEQFQSTNSGKDVSEPTAGEIDQHNLDKYKCLKCDSDFITNSDYQDHLRLHERQKKFKCSKCSAGYNEENNFKIHMILNHPSGEERSCPICNVTLKHARAAGLKSHLMIHQVEELHSCEKCRAEFEKEDDYVKHMKSHDSKQKTVQPFTCSHCKVHFENRNDYRSHISEHQKARRIFTKPKRNRKSCLPKAKQFSCSVCEKRFMKISLLERHERIHTGEKPFKCDKCDQCFTQKGTLQMHYDRHSGRKPFVCTMCPAKFTQKGNLKVHIRKTHTFPDKGHKMYKCSHCTCIFKTIGSLNGHVTKIHLKPGAPENVVLNVMMNLKELGKQVNKTASPLSIENGNESESNSKIEQVVMKEVNNALQNKSFTPEKTYVTLTESSYDGSVRKHVVQHKKVGDVRWYCCEYCTKQCKKPSDLIRHIRMHTREKPFQCEICPKTFTLKSTLLSHKNTHNSHKSFKCKSCDAVFGSSRVLNAHIRKHEFEKLTKWVCTVCKCMFDDFEKALAHKMEEGQSHVIQSVLNTVMKQPLYQTIYGNLTLKPPRSRVPNTGTEPSLIRPFHCVICDARFTRKVNLNRHLRYHAGERKYKCHMCPKTFITSYRLKEHLNFHNNIKNYGCKICNKRFVTSTLLKRHTIIHSTDKPYMCPYCSKHFKTILLSRHHIKMMHKKDVLPEFVGGELVDFTAHANDLRSPENQGVGTDSVSSNISIPQTDEHRKSDSLSIQDQNISQSISNEVINSEYLIKQGEGEYQAVYVTVDDMNLLQNSNLVLDSTLNPPMKLMNAENVIVDGLNVVMINPDTGNELVAASVHKELEQDSLLTYSNSMEPLNDLTISVNDPGTIFDGNTVFQTSSSLNESKNIFDDANIICMTCNRVFSSFVIFQKHGCEQKTASVATEPSLPADASTSTEMVQQEAKCKNRESYTCQICKESFSNKLAFKKHLKKHPKQDTFECRICKTAVGSKTAYLEHMSLHTSSSNNFTCVFCVKIFKKASDLKRHLRVHTGEKPFSCPICNRSFSLKSTMLAHTRTHNPTNKEFNCVICNSFYSSKASLRVHMSVHTGQKAYPCHFCKMKFRTSANRKSHEVKKHSSKKTKSAEGPKNKITDVLRLVASEMIMNSDQDSETISTPQSVLQNDSRIADQEEQPKQSTQIINLDIIPEEILTTPADQITMDPSLLLQQIQMSDIVLTTDDNNGMNSFILDEVNLLDLNATTSNLQIISLPQADEGNGVTISISEVEKKQGKPKNVQCDICNKSYSTKEVLRRHKKNVHGEKVDLSCSKCNKKFKSKVTYDRHCKTHPEMKLTNQEATTNATRERLQIDTESDHQPAQVGATRSLLNMKFDLSSATVGDPMIFNSLFSIKKV